MLPIHLAPFAFMILTSDSVFRNGSGGDAPKYAGRSLWYYIRAIVARMSVDAASQS
jgi:hypothetical protein